METVLKVLITFYFLMVVNRSWSMKQTRKATNQKYDTKVALMGPEAADIHREEPVVPEDIHREEPVVLQDILQDDQVVPEEDILQEVLEVLAVDILQEDLVVPEVAIPQEALVVSEMGMLQEGPVVPEVDTPPEGKAAQVADIPVVGAG
jgi:hypothetical protein